MAYDTLKGLIRQYIKTNGQNEITGQILQNVLIAMVDEYPSLTGYATQQWVQSQGYLTDADLSNFATQTWVEAQLLGYLPTSTTLINSVIKSDDGSLKLSGRNFADTYIDFTHTHRFEELTDIPTLLQDFGITGGTLSDLTVNNATVNNTLVITNGNDYVSIAGEGITIMDEDAGTFNIYMSSAGYMAVDTSIVASSFVKNGGTSSQFLKADGSVDSNAYITSSALTGYATQSWVNTQLAGYLPLSAGSGNPLTGDLYMDDNYVRFESGTQAIGYSSRINSSQFYIDKSTAATLGTDSVSVEGGKITVYSEYNDFDEGMVSNELVITATGIKVNNQPFATQNWVQSQGYATQSWVQQQGYITSAALTGYATQTWVGQYFVPISATYINEVTKSDDGTLKFAGSNFADTYVDFTHTHRFEELTDLPTLLQDFGITGGTLSELTVNNATVNNTLVITNGNDYVSIAGEGITIVDEDAGTFNIYMSSAGYMAVDTSIVASSFIKNGGTSSQFLKADGSVDSNAYITSAALTGYATQSWVNTQLGGYLPLSAGSGKPLTGDLYMDDNYVRFESGTQAIGYSSRINSSQFYIDKSTAATLGTDSVSVEGGKITVYSEYNDFDEGMVSNELVITATGIKVNNQPFATQNWVQSQGYATQSWVQQQGYITSAALTGYATQTWVGQYFVPISATYINEVTKSDDGTLKFAGSNFADTYVDFTHTHRFEELTDIPTLLQDFGITGGTLSDLTVNNATVNNTLVITNGNDYVSIAGEGITIVDEDAGTFNIYMSSAGYMAVDTSIVASSFIKNGGTSSQFLKADGSVDSNTYATQTWVQQQGYITSSALTGYATQSWVNTQLAGYLPTSTALMNAMVKSADGSMKFSGRNFADTYVDFTHDHRWEEITDRPNIEIGGYGMTYTDGNFGIGIQVPTNKLEVNGTSFFYSYMGVGTSPTSSYTIDVDGQVRAAGFVNNSDARLKDIEDYDAHVFTEAVAMAPAVHYQWKNRNDRGLKVGSIAQYWQNVLPEAVSTDDKGYLSMQYDVIALISAISIAKRTVEHEQRIAELESENAQLRLELNSIKEAIKTT